MSLPRATKVGLMTCAVLAFSAVPATARIIDVAPNGSDATGDGSAAQPLRTIVKALSVAAGDDTVALATGDYGDVTDATVRDQPVSIVAADPGAPPSLGHVRVTGGTGLHFDHVNLDSIAIAADNRHTRAPDDIQVTNAEITDPGENCVIIRDGATNILFQDDHIHDCQNGIGGPPTTLQSSSIKIVDDTLDHFTDNGIIFGNWDDVEITGNDIGYIDDPTGRVHPDGVQLTGNSSHVVIQDNLIHDSGRQLLFVQPQYGPIDDVLVAGNVMRGAGAIAFQDLAATGMRIVNNTVADTTLGGILVRARHDADGNVIADGSDTVVANNVVSSTLSFKEVTPAVNEDNVAKPQGGLAALGLGADLRPLPGAAVCGAGDFRYAPLLDRDGHVFGLLPAIGAYACPLIDVGLGSPAQAAGVPASVDPEAAPIASQTTGSVASPAAPQPEAAPTDAAPTADQASDSGCSAGKLSVDVLKYFARTIGDRRLPVCASRNEFAAGLMQGKSAVGIVVNLGAGRTTGLRDIGLGTRLSTLRVRYPDLARVRPDVFAYGKTVFVLKNGRVRWAGVSQRPLSGAAGAITVSR